MPALARKTLTAYSIAPLESIDRTTVRWQKQLVADTLRAIWHSRTGALRMPYTVYTHRLLLKLRASFDRQGYRLRMATELSHGTMVIRIVQKRTGNRPWRT